MAAVSQFLSVMGEATDGLSANVFAWQPDLTSLVTQGYSFQEAGPKCTPHVYDFTTPSSNSNCAYPQQTCLIHQCITHFNLALRQVKNVSLAGSGDKILRELEQV